MIPEQLPKINLGEMTAYMPQRKEPSSAAPAQRTNQPHKQAPEEKPEGIGRLGMQLLISAAICGAVLGMRYMDLPITQQALAGIKLAVSSEEPYDKAIGRLTFVSNLFPDTAQVFSVTRANIIPPITGDLISASADEIVYSAPHAQNVRAIAAGRVFYAGNNTVRLVHPSGYESVYQGIMPGVKAGQELEAGDTIGSIAQGERLNFSLYCDGKTVSAADLLG